MAVGPSVTDWISAVSTAALGVLGTFVTVWQWHRSGFGPKLSSRIDAAREAIELQIVNKGRIGGIISQVEVVKSDPAGRDYVVIDDVTVEGFAGGAFQPVRLPAMTSMLLVILAPDGRPFSAGVRLAVGAGASGRKMVTPVETPPGLGLSGLTSVLPPAPPP